MLLYIHLSLLQYLSYGKNKHDIESESLNTASKMIILHVCIYIIVPCDNVWYNCTLVQCSYFILLIKIKRLIVARTLQQWTELDIKFSLIFHRL